MSDNSTSITLRRSTVSSCTNKAAPSVIHCNDSQDFIIHVIYKLHLIFMAKILVLYHDGTASLHFSQYCYSIRKRWKNNTMILEKIRFTYNRVCRNV